MAPSGDSAEASTPRRRYHQNGVLRGMEQRRPWRQEALDLGDGARQRSAHAGNGALGPRHHAGARLSILKQQQHGRGEIVRLAHLRAAA